MIATLFALFLGATIFWFALCQPLLLLTHIILEWSNRPAPKPSSKEPEPWTL